MSAEKKELIKVRRALRRNELGETQIAASRPGFFVPLPASVIGMLILAAVVIGAGVFAWSLISRDPGDDSPEAGFLRDMVTHHAQAVEMAGLIYDRTQDPLLKGVAKEILLGQQQQIGTMQGYLTLWDLSGYSDRPPMAWMGMPVEGLMPGMATQEQEDQLTTLPIDQAEVLFLQLMIRHHQGGVLMAQGLLERSDQDDVRLIADRIVYNQNNEIAVMNDLLIKRGQPPITDPLPDHEMSGM